MSLKAALLRDLDLVCNAERETLRRNVVRLFAASSTRRHKTIAGLHTKRVWDGVTDLFREAGSNFGKLAVKYAVWVVGESLAREVKLARWAKEQIATARENIEDRAYIAYRVAGGSGRGSWHSGNNARSCFQIQFAMAEYEAVKAATCKIYHSGKQDVDAASNVRTGITDVRSKAVREGEVVEQLYSALKQLRRLYRQNGWSATQVRQKTQKEFAVLWEWTDRMPELVKLRFLRLNEWEDGDEFIYGQVATLYEYAGHKRKKPSPSTVRDWRKRYRGWRKHGTAEGGANHR
jgi:hypothetical protein